MDRYTAEVGWSEEQCNRVTKIVQAEAQKARVAAQFLPTSLTPDVTATGVPRRLLTYPPIAPSSPEQRMEVDNDPTTMLTSFGVNVSLSSQEMADPEQSSALIQFRRAGNVIARLEDALIFRGQSAKNATPDGVGNLPQIFDVRGGGAQPGLLSGATATPRGSKSYKTAKAEDAGQALVNAIIAAIGDLEAAGHSRPFACVLGQNAFAALHNPTSNLILPRDRVVPFLDGPLLRSSTLPPDEGIVVALGGSPIEIVVSSELHVRFLQISPYPAYVFRVSERVALRVTDWTSIVVLNNK